ncbi:MAG: ATP-dependent DNA ligase [Myxococcota bacterium]
MAATLTEERFAGAQWSFERKIDGIRLLAFKQGQHVKLFSRTRREQQLPHIAHAVASLLPHDLILDGEVEWDGSAFHVFDVLWMDGQASTAEPLEQRRARLSQLDLQPPLLRVPVLHDDKPWERAAAEGWEGVIAKRVGSPYEHRRSRLWLKMKCEASQELVVGGFTEPQGKRVGLGALLVGYFQGGDFVFAGKVGTGLDTRMLLELRARLDAAAIPGSPFTVATGLPRDRVRWVRPDVVVQVAFLEWTGHGKMRHPRLLGIRNDKPARAVVRES